MENDIKLGAEVDNNQERDNKKLELKIDGISCQACVAKIERKLSRTDGVEKALVNISNNMADIEYNEKEIKASEIMKIIETKSAPGAVGAYSQGIVSNGFVYSSGQLPLVPETGELISDDVKKATRQSLENVKAIVEAGGSSVEKIVKVNIFLDDVNDFAAVNEAYAEFFGDHKPARSCVEVGKLPKNGLLEIEAIAEI